MPALVGVHSAALARLVSAENLPVGHGSAAGAPSSQYEPGLHCSHAVAFDFDWKRPASQLIQFARPLMLPKLPALHVFGALLPPEHQLATGHALQSAWTI